MNDEPTSGVEAAWNRIADEHNSWSALSLDEQDTFARFAAALSTPAASPASRVDREAIKRAIRKATADEFEGRLDGDIIEKGCEAAEYVDPSDAAERFVDIIADEVIGVLTPAASPATDAASLVFPTGERITRKDLNNAYRAGQENGRLFAECFDTASPSPASAAVEELVARLTSDGFNERQYVREARMVLSHLLEEAATALSTLAADKARAEAERDGWKANCQVQLEETHRNMRAKAAAVTRASALEGEVERLTRQLRALAVALHGKHYAEQAKGWQPLDDAEGLLSQIDNMTTGLARFAATPASEQEAVYRFLDNGEAIEAGDECPSDDCSRWEPVNRWAIGSKRSSIFKVIRRRARAALSPAKETP